MITFQDVCLQINNKLLLDKVTISIPDNQKTVIIGKSGCGKTLLMKSLLGLHRINSGTIKIDGEDISQTKSEEAQDDFNKVSMVFQNAALLDSFTVYQNVSLPLFEKSKLTGSEIREKVNDVLNFVGLISSSELYPSDLSGGMRKRVAIARSLISQPKYIILDEPTTGLDPYTAKETITFIKDVIISKKIIPITITHDPFCIKEMGEYIIILDNGKAIFQGKIQDIAKNSNRQIIDFYDSFFIQ
jgi:phospholipid/cholesterol/gamma-HCH transport system ATP-binding protein